MDKGKIRVALAALSVVGLLAGLTLTGCKSSSCGSSCNGKVQQKAGSSCGAGSCSGTKPETKPSDETPKAPEVTPK